MEKERELKPEETAYLFENSRDAEEIGREEKALKEIQKLNTYLHRKRREY